MLSGPWSDMTFVIKFVMGGNIYQECISFTKSPVIKDLPLVD
jgi:hypothetical protein